jgi:hypothetical protein
MIFEAVLFVGFLGIIFWKWIQIFVFIRQHGIKTILEERPSLLPGVLVLTSIFTLRHILSYPFMILLLNYWILDRMCNIYSVLFVSLLYQLQESRAFLS